MRVDIFSCETSQCDPQVIYRKKDGKVFYGLRMRFCQCLGVDENWITFWAEGKDAPLERDALERLRVFATVMKDKIESHIEGKPSEDLEHV